MNLIRQVREQFNESQRDFSMRLGVSVDTIKSWESERRSPSEAHVDMLLLLNEKSELNSYLKILHPTHRMAEAITNYIKDEISSSDEDISLRFVLCGASGCGKSRSISLINEAFGADEAVAECIDLTFKKNLCEAWNIVNDTALGYENSKHIAFSIMSKDVAESLELKGLKVFYF